MNREPSKVISKAIREVLDNTEVEHLVTVSNVENLEKELSRAVFDALYPYSPGILYIPESLAVNTEQIAEQLGKRSVVPIIVRNVDDLRTAVAATEGLEVSEGTLDDFEKREKAAREWEDPYKPIPMDQLGIGQVLRTGRVRGISLDENGMGFIEAGGGQLPVRTVNLDEITTERIYPEGTGYLNEQSRDRGEDGEHG